MHLKYLLLLGIANGCTTVHGQDVLFRQPSSYVQRFIGNDSISWNSINHHSFRIYFKDSSFTSQHLDTIAQELDLAFSRVLEVLDLKFYDKGIYLLAVDSKEEMKQLMGYSIKGGAAQGHDLVFFVCNQKIRPQFKHELFHLISYETWGPTAHRLLDEGGATFCDNFCFYDNPMYSINSYFRQQNQLVPIDSLVHHFDGMARKNDVLAYIQSAGIFKYLYEKYGRVKLKQLWQEGFESFQRIYGITIEAMYKDWMEFIQSVPIPADFDINDLREGCG